jgi:hypothetical protein
MKKCCVLFEEKTESTPNVIVNVRHALLYECVKKLKLSSDGGDFGNKKCSTGYAEVNGRVWRSLRLAGV